MQGKGLKSTVGPPPVSGTSVHKRISVGFIGFPSHAHKGIHQTVVARALNGFAFPGSGLVGTVAQDVVHRPAKLRSVLQRTAAAYHLNALNGLHGRGVVGFGVAQGVRGNVCPVLAHVKLPAAVGA